VDGGHSNSIATVTDPGTTSVRTDLRALPRPVWFLLVGSFVNRFGSFVLPFLALYLTHHRGYTAAQAGLALSAYGIGSVSAAAAGGVLADHLGRRGTIALSMYSSAVVMLALSQAGSLAATSLVIGVIYFQQEATLPLQVVADGHSTAVYGLLISLNGLVGSCSSCR
jgi:predicted MFS family arabinose efflux permease